MSAFDPLRGFTPNVFNTGQQQNGFGTNNFIGEQGQGSNESEKAATARSFPGLGVPSMYNPLTSTMAAAAAAMQAAAAQMQTQMPGQLSPAAMKAAAAGNGTSATDAFGNFFGTHPSSFYNTSTLLSSLSSAAQNVQNPYSTMNSLASNYGLNGQANQGQVSNSPYSLAQSIGGVSNSLPVSSSASPFSDFRNPFAYFMMKPEERISSMTKLSPPQIV